MQPRPRRRARPSPPRSGRSRPRGAGRSGRSHRCGCRTTGRAPSCSSPSTRCASPAGLRRCSSSTMVRPAWDPSRARSRGRRPSRTRRPRPAPRPAAGRDPGGPGVRRPATTRSGRRSSRRRSGRRGRARAASRSSATMSSMCSVARGRTSGIVIRRAVAVGEEARRGSGRRASPMSVPAAAAPRMILSSMSVMFITQRHRIAAPAQVADQQVGEQERAEVADVGGSVHRRAARVDPDVVVAQRHERPGLAGQRVEQPDGHRPALQRCAMARALIERPAPSAPSRLPGRRLDVDRVARPGRGVRAIASRIASRWPPRRGRAADDGHVDARSPASRPRRAARRTSSSSAALAIAARRRGRRPGTAGRGRRARPRRAARRRRRAARRRRRSGRGGAGRPRSRSRRGQPVARPERMRVVADAAAGRCRPFAEQERRASQVGGHRHLEVVRIAGDDMDRDGTGLEQGGLVRPRLRPVGRESPIRRRAGRPAARPAASGRRRAPVRSTVPAIDRRRRRA